MYRLLGILNALLLVVITSPYWLRRVNQWLFGRKNKAIAAWIKVLRKAHKPLGLLLAVLAPVHGILALGSLRMHTGTLVWIAVLVTVVLGGMFFRLKKAPLFAWHKRAALLTVLLLLVHLIVPSALWYIFR